jgi:Ca2+/Na+ antiporter
MLGVVGKVFAGIAALVGVVALMSSPQQAAKTAGSSMGTVGITIGALAGSIPDLVTGFNVAREASNRSGINQRRVNPGPEVVRPNRPKV